MDNDYSGIRRQTMKSFIEGTQGSCWKLTKSYIESPIHSFNEIFPYIHIFNEEKLFNPCYCLEEHRSHEKI